MFDFLCAMLKEKSGIDPQFVAQDWKQTEFFTDGYDVEDPHLVQVYYSIDRHLMVRIGLDDNFFKIFKDTYLPDTRWKRDVYGAIVMTPALFQFSDSFCNLTDLRISGHWRGDGLAVITVDIDAVKNEEDLAQLVDFIVPWLTKDTAIYRAPAPAHDYIVQWLSKAIPPGADGDL